MIIVPRAFRHIILPPIHFGLQLSKKNLEFFSIQTFYLKEVLLYVKRLVTEAYFLNDFFLKSIMLLIMPLTLSFRNKQNCFKPNHQQKSKLLYVSLAYLIFSIHVVLIPNRLSEAPDNNSVSSS